MKKSVFLLAFCLSNLLGFSQSLVSISPNSSQVGQLLSTTITGSGTTFSNSSPQGNIQNVYLQLAGTNIIYGDWFTIFVTDDQHFDVNWTIPGGAPIGIYDLYVDLFDPFTFSTYTLTLPAAFTIGTPDGYIQGRIFNDLNNNGLQDGGENGVSGYYLSISPIGVTITTDTNGDYLYAATNGNYNVSYLGNTSNQMVVVPPFPSNFPITINNANSTGNNFPVIAGVDAFYPDSSYQGQTITVTVYGNGFFSTAGGPNGNISSARFSRGTTNITIPSNKIAVIDSNTATLQFTVPTNASLGLYNFYLYSSSGNFIGYHYKNNFFKIVGTPLTMTGIVFFDSDSDGVQDPGESGVGGEKLLLLPDNIYAYSDVNGAYSFGVFPGTHTISWVQQSSLVSLAPNNPSSYTATVATSTSGYNFGVLASNSSAYSGTVSFQPCWAGCVHPNFFRIIIQNTSAITYGGYVYMNLDANMTYVPNGGGGYWGPSPDSVSASGTTLYWHFSNLAPLASKTFSAYISTPIGGVTINYSATLVSESQPGVAEFMNTVGNTHVVNCSMDPNEKSVKPPGFNTQHYTLLSDTLEYTVLFQNTGTDTAFTVVIRDTIDSNLDLTTMQVMSASHPIASEIPLGTRVAKFTFNNILLPDSNTNEGLSHGYVVYRIRKLPGTPSNTIVYNKADIYFDFNKPVTTNETFNTLVTVIPGAPVADFTASNPRFCATGSTTFNDVSSNTPTSWTWSFPGGTPSTSTAQNPTVTYMVRGIYDVTLTATNASGNGSITKTGYIVIDSLPAALISPISNQTICLGNTFTLNASSNIAPVTYQWQKNNVDIPGATASSYAASQQAAYRVRITNTSNSCSKLTVPVTVFTQRPTAPITAIGSTTFCSNGSIQLQSSGSVSNSFQWLKNNSAISGATATSYTATSYGGYSVRVTDNLGCTNTSRAIYVTVYQNPVVAVSANGPLTFCAGQSVTLSVAPQANTTYQWTNNGATIPGATLNQYTANAAGKYRITAINSHSCSNTSSVKQVIINCRMASTEYSSIETEGRTNFTVYPNPADNNAHIYFDLPQNDNIDISVYDMLGKKVSTLENDSYSGGSYELQLNTESLQQGIYFIRLTTNDQLRSLKLVVNHQ